MEKMPEGNDFPIISSGGWILLLPDRTDDQSKSVFEMGSGYGYSTAWFAKAVKENGGGVVRHVVLGAEALGNGRGHLSRLWIRWLDPISGCGSGRDACAELPVCFDLIFNDINKEAYPASLPLIKEKLWSGGF